MTTLLRAACAPFVALLTLSITLTPVKAAVPSYTVTDLGTLGGGFTGASGINATGQITGSADTTNPNAYGHAYLYDGSMHDLGSLAGSGFQSAGSSINASGHIAGLTTVPGGQEHAMFYDGSMHDLGTLGTGTSSGATGINDKDEIVGYSDTTPDFFTNYERAFLYDGTMHDLGTLGGQVSFAYGINARGQITGYAESINAAHAFIWTPTTPNGNTGTMVDIDGMAGRFSIAYAINDNGWATGELFTAFGPRTAFFYDGTMHDIGSLDGLDNTIGASINNSGVIVGESGFGVAFIYSTATGMIDLNTLIDPASGWVLTGASGINDAGQIIGTGTFDGENRAFLLTPVPEPATIILSAISSFGLILLYRNQQAKLHPLALDSADEHFGRLHA